MPVPAPTPWSDLPAPPRATGGLSAPSPQTPLAGLTLLLVEDSRFACDALRLVTHRVGARLRRAETLAQARHHLRTYRPDVVIVDLGLPDGRGEDLIADLCRLGGPPALAISGDDDGLGRARRAGAAGFLAKPLGSIGTIARAILSLLPERAWLIPAVPDGIVATPDPLALRDDLAEAARRLAGAPGSEGRSYVAGFVTGLARASRDAGLEAAARAEAGAAGGLARAIADRLNPGDTLALPRSASLRPAAIPRPAQRPTGS